MPPALKFDYLPVCDSGSKKSMIWVMFHGTKSNLTIRPVINNCIIYDDLRRYVQVSFENLKFEDDPENRKYFQYIKDILTNGIEIQDKLFLFCGHSNEQLKSRSCFLYQAKSHSEILAKINSFGNSFDVQDVANRSKQIGHLFTIGKQMISLKSYCSMEIDNIVSNNRVFPDGCGFISQEFAAEVVKNYLDENIGNFGCSKNTKYIPQVIQVRYRGYMGTLIPEDHQKLNPPVKHSYWKMIYFWLLSNLFGFKPEIKVAFRKSMRRFENYPSGQMIIMEHSEPCNPDKLTSRHISILSSLGVKNEIFVKKLFIQFELTRKAFKDKNSAIQFLEFRGMYPLAGKLRGCVTLEAAPRFIHQEIRNAQCEEFKSFLENELHMHIRISKSRVLTGVFDPFGVLKADQCFIKLTHNRKTLEASGKCGKIFVSRNPCLHPGDIQIFTAVDNIPELDNLVDCIVFSTATNFPSNSQMGGDLIHNGDNKFLVCWDKELMPPTSVRAIDFSKINCSVIPFKGGNQQLDLIDYFANYDHRSSERVLELYFKWIRVHHKRAFSNECLELTILYVKWMKGENIVIPNYLCQPPELDTSLASPFILDILLHQVKEYIRDRFVGFYTTFSKNNRN